MECETLGLKWTCSRLCPSRSGNGALGHECGGSPWSFSDPQSNPQHAILVRLPRILAAPRSCKT